MKVVRVDPPHGRDGHQRVVFDRGVTIRLPPDDITALGIQPGVVLDGTAAREIRRRAERALAVGIADRLLAVRLRSRRELEDRLRHRGISADVLASVMADLERYGFIDDRRFAEAWVRTRRALLPSGRIRLQYELARKGVAPDAVSQVLVGVGGGDEEELALAVAQGRIRRYRGLQPEVIHRRLGGILQRRGFSSGVIARVLRHVLGVSAKADD
jgi:regulatory protein